MLTGIDTVGVASKPILKYCCVSVEKHCQTFFRSLSNTEEVLPTIFFFTFYQIRFFLLTHGFIQHAGTSHLRER